MEIYYSNSQRYTMEDEVLSDSGQSYEIGDRLGAGGNGVVYECFSRNGDSLAIKFLIQNNKKNTERFKQEIRLMERLKHPNIIHYVDCGSISMVNSHGQIDCHLFVIMEKADKNLINFMKEQKKIDYNIYAGQFRGLCEALEEMHNYAIHRDIKPENILIKGDRWLLSDFGLCEFLSTEEHQDLTGANEKIGPKFWMSPEAVDSIYFGSTAIGKYSDVFQLCAIFVFVLTRRYPGGMMDADDEMNTTPEIKSLLLQALSNNYLRRPADGHELVQRYNEATYLAE